jgi:hypothetical protein
MEFEYPFITFLVVFEIAFIWLLSMSNIGSSISGVGELPQTPTNAWGYPIYVGELFFYFFQFLIVPTVPVSLKFLSSILFAPLTIVFSWIILRVIIPLIQSIIGIIP